VLLLASALSRCGGASSSPTASPSSGPSSTPGPPTLGPQGTTITQVANEGWLHVPEGSSVRYSNNPPASGPHYPVWARFEEFTPALPRGYWVHNLEHGAIVFLYRPDTPAATVDALRSVYRGLPPDPTCGNLLALMTPDPELPKPIAAVAADWVLTAEGVDAPTIQAFVTAHRNRGPERVCAPGTR
jgi:uncharacterized protein DUF3105